MFRNAESHFANVPSIDIQRSKMKIPFEHKTSFNVGQVIPIYLSEILPGDTVKMTHSAVIRLQTMLTPVMDNLVADFYWFFVPNRLVLNRWNEVMQENTAGPWAPQTQYAIPTISAPSGGFAVGSLADYMGLPVGVNWANTDKNAPSALPFRGYAKIMDEFFRSEVVSYPLNIPLSDSNQTGTNGSSYINDVANGGAPFVAARTHDYFSSCLPTAQKAVDPVTFPLISGSKAPVFPVTSHWGKAGDNVPSGMDDLYWLPVSSGKFTAAGSNNADLKISPVSSEYQTRAYPDATGSSPYSVFPVNLVADLSKNVGAVTVSELRLAFQLQRWYEASARAGSRLTETIRQFFGVVSPDARLQRPEYLGGNRVPITINQVVNTSSDSGSSSVPLGHLGAVSQTADIHVDFEHSFVEHGYLFGLVVCRVAHHTFSQGLEKHWLRKVWTDFYWPTFAHLGEMPVKSAQIYAAGNMDSDDVFGYQEAWAEYRYMPNRTSAELRPGVANTLASWHFGDYYTQTPTLSDTWMREPVANVDRTLAVTSAVANQIFADFAFNAVYTRAMPVYSVPGLIDHF